MDAHIALLLDRSGSMANVRDDTIGGVNTFFEVQRQVPRETTVTIAQFDDEFEYLYEGRRLAEVKKLTRESFVPRGNTALLDAACRLIDETGYYLTRMPSWQRPEKVFLVIVTDGMENASKRHTLSDLNHRVDHQRKRYAWEFVFLGADQDAITVASQIGIARHAAMDYRKSKLGIENVYIATAMNVADVRAGVKSHISFTDAERAASMQRDEP